MQRSTPGGYHHYLNALNNVNHFTYRSKALHYMTPGWPNKRYLIGVGFKRDSPVYVYAKEMYNP